MIQEINLPLPLELLLMVVLVIILIKLARFSPQNETETKETIKIPSDTVQARYGAVIQIRE